VLQGDIYLPGLPVYNRRRFVSEAIASIFAQTVTPGELIVVDDASTDGSPEYMEKLISSAPPSGRPERPCPV
jgi:glycosyltransferase involved in cell wall biosynthesis